MTEHVNLISQFDEETRTQRQKDQLVQAESGRRYAIQTLNPAILADSDFKQLVESDEYGDDIAHLVELAAASKVTVETLSDPRYEGFVRRCAQLGITAAQAAEHINTLATKASELADVASSFDELGKSVTSLKEKLDLVQQAQSESTDAGSVTFETYQKLVEAGEEYVGVLDEIDGRLVVNANRLRELEDAQSDNIKEQLESAKTLKETEYDETAKSLEAARKELEAYSEGTEGYAAALAKVNGYEADLGAIDGELNSLKAVTTEINAMSSAYAKYLKSKNGSESGDKFDVYKGATDSVKEALKTGKVGTNEYKDAVEMILGNGALDGKNTKEKTDLGKDALKLYERYFAKDKTSSKNFIDDLVKNGLATKDGKNVDLIEGLTAEQVSEKLGISIDAIEAAFGELEEYDWQVDWTGMFPEGTDAYNRGVETRKEFDNGFNDGVNGKVEPSNDSSTSSKGGTQGDNVPGGGRKATVDGSEEPSAPIIPEVAPQEVLITLKLADGSIEGIQAQISGINGEVGITTNADEASALLAQLGVDVSKLPPNSTVAINLTGADGALTTVSSLDDVLAAVRAGATANITAKDSTGTVITDTQAKLNGITGEIDITAADKASDTVDDIQTKIDGVDGTINVGLNTESADESLDALVSRLTKPETKIVEIAEKHLPSVEASTKAKEDEARTRVQHTSGAELDPAYYERTVNIDVDANLEDAQAHIEQLGAGIDNVELFVDANTSTAQSEIDALALAIAAKNPTMTVTIRTVGDGSLPAFAKGTRKAKDGPALVDDGTGSNAGPELIEHKRAGTYELGTSSGPRITQLESGDIVHTAKETKEILKRRGIGALFGKKNTVRSGDAFATGVGGGGLDLSDGGSGSSGNKKSNRKSKKNTGGNWKKYVQKLFDWIEIRLARLQKVTDKWVESIKHAVGYVAKNLKIDMAIKSIQDQIKAAEDGYARYVQEMATLKKKMGLSDEYIQKIENGEIDIETLKPKLREKIEEYMKWRDKAEDVKDSIDDLIEQEKELKKQRLDNIIEDYTFKTDRQDAAVTDAESRIDLKVETGREVTSDDYAKAIDASNKKLAIMVEQRAAMLEEFKRLVAEGTILEGSEDWYDYTSKLEDLDNAMLQTQTSIASFQKSVEQIAIDKLTYALEALTHAQDAAQNAIDHKIATGRKLTERDFQPLINSSKQQIANLNEQIALMRQYQSGLDVNSERYQELEADIRSNEKAIWDAQKAQLEWNEAILDLPLTNLQYTLKAIQDIKSAVEGMNDLHIAQGLDPTREYYQELVDLGMREINNMEEQNRLLRERLIGMDVESDKWQEINNEIKSNEEAILDMKTAQEEWVDAIVDIKIDELEKMRDELEKTNDSYKKRIELEKAIQNLERAKQQRTKLVYKDGQGFVYTRDEKAVKDATEDLADKRHEETIDKIDEIIDQLEESKKNNNIYDYDANLLKEVDWAARGVDLDKLYEGLRESIELNPIGSMMEEMSRSITTYASTVNNGGDVVIEKLSVEVSGAGDPEAVGKAVIKEISNGIIQQLPLKTAQALAGNR